MKGSRFSLLLTKFTTREEVVGPISIRGLKEDRYRRVTAGKLPEAELAFLDELFKGSSAILNTLLKMLNERVFENDGATVPVPLKLCLAASNEWPQAYEGGKELNALFDRLLFRKAVRPQQRQRGLHPPRRPQSQALHRIPPTHRRPLARRLRHGKHKGGCCRTWRQVSNLSEKPG